MHESRCAEVGLQGRSVTHAIAAERQLLGSGSIGDGFTGRLMEGHRPSATATSTCHSTSVTLLHMPRNGRLHSIP